MVKCLNCKRELDILKSGQHAKVFCNKECLKEYCDEYLAQNWRDYAYMMGVTIRD